MPEKATITWDPVRKHLDLQFFPAIGGAPGPAPWRMSEDQALAALDALMEWKFALTPKRATLSVADATDTVPNRIYLDARDDLRAERARTDRLIGLLERKV